MASKAERRRKKRAAQAREGNQATQGTQTPKRAAQRDTVALSVTPTPERLVRGSWAKGKGRTGPMVDLAPDMIGELHQAGQLSDAQEQAARDFMGLYAANLADLGVTGYRSCLAGGIAGHDDSDGNTEAVAAYKAMRNRIGRVKTALLQVETVKDKGDKPGSITALRVALDCFIG